jgi:starch synthase
MERPLRVLFVASECAPFARVGALGDAVGALPAALRRRGVDARVVIPRFGWISPVNTDGMSKHLAPLAVPLGDAEAWCAVYEAPLPGSDAPVYMLDHEVLFDRPYLYDPPGAAAHDNHARFAFLSRGAFQLAKHLGWAPDVMHAHDWPSALVAVYLDTVEARGMFRRTAAVLGVHGIKHQGRFSRDEARDTQLDAEAVERGALEDHGGVNLLKGGLAHAAKIVTTTRRYADALRTPEGSAGLDAVLSSRGDDLAGLVDDDPPDWDLAAERLVAIYADALARRRGA